MKGDVLGLRKMLVASTTSGKILGIDSENGNIVWSFFLNNIKNPRTFLVRSSASYPVLSLLIGETPNV